MTQMATRGIAVFGITALTAFFSPRGCLFAQNRVLATILFALLHNTHFPKILYRVVSRLEEIWWKEDL